MPKPSLVPIFCLLIAAVVLIFLMDTACPSHAQPPPDPIPDSLRAGVLKSALDMTTAETAKREAMQAYHRAETKYEGALHNWMGLIGQANALCEKAGLGPFDMDTAKCKPTAR